jgi:hypothetical protein
MDRNFYAQLEKVLRDKESKRKSRNQLIVDFLNALEQCVNDLTKQASGTRACTWGVEDGNGQFDKHNYQGTMSGFSFDLQISFYDTRGQSIFERMFPFSANLKEDVIQVTHNESWAFITPGSYENSPGSFKEVADLLDKSLREQILDECELISKEQS